MTTHVGTAASAGQPKAIQHLDIQAQPGVDLVGDLTDLGYLKHLTTLRFRSAFCMNLLEHVTNREQIAAALVEVLPPGGLLFVSVPHRFPYHPDPIDTLYRPDAAELARLFPGTAVVHQENVRCGTLFGYMWDRCRYRPGR